MIKTKVAFVLSGLGVGGNETWAVSCLTELNRNFFSPIVISLSEESGPLEISLSAIRVPIVRIPVDKMNYFRFMLNFSSVIRESKVNAVLSAGFSTRHLFIHAAGLLGGARVRLSRVSASPPDPQLRSKLRWIQRASRFVCTHEIAISYSVATWLKSFGGYPPDRIRVISNGCDVARIRARADSVRKNPELRPKRVIMVARLEGAKDHETLLRAMVEVRQVLADVELLLVGEGPRRQELETLANRMNCGVRFLGSRADVPELLGAADVFVFSTRTEGFGIVLIEAMAAGLPVVASDIPACREVLDGGRAGLLFAVGDSSQLARYLIQLFCEEYNYAHYAAASTKRVAKYDLASMVLAYEKLLVGSP